MDMFGFDCKGLCLKECLLSSHQMNEAAHNLLLSPTLIKHNSALPEIFIQPVS